MENKYHTRRRRWLGERGSVCLSIMRLPVKVYSELLGCSHCTSPAIRHRVFIRLRQHLNSDIESNNHYISHEYLNHPLIDTKVYKRAFIWTIR